MKRSSLAILISLVVAMSGCRSVGNFFISPHANSDKRSPDRVCVRFTRPPRETALGAALLAKLAEIAVEQVGKAIEKESKRYRATYSGRDSDELLSRHPNGEVSLAVTGFEVVRLYGDDASVACDGLTDLQKAAAPLWFVAEINLSNQRDAIRFIPKRFSFTQSKAKAAKVSWQPWSWWLPLDDSKGKVDVDVQIALSAIVKTEAGRTESVLATRDFPFGKVDLGEGKLASDDDLRHLKSGWIPIPQIDPPDAPDPGATAKFLPVNLVVTIIEANELGDVIAKGAEKFEKKQDSIESKLKELVGGSSE